MKIFAYGTYGNEPKCTDPKISRLGNRRFRVETTGEEFAYADRHAVLPRYFTTPKALRHAKKWVAFLAYLDGYQPPAQKTRNPFRRCWDWLL